LAVLDDLLTLANEIGPLSKRLDALEIRLENQVGVIEFLADEVRDTELR
jgi:uncharacterized coiled-coil protein SlyX